MKLVPYFKPDTIPASSAGAWVSEDGCWHIVAATDSTGKRARRGRWQIVAMGSPERILSLREVGLGSDEGVYFKTRQAATAALELALSGLSSKAPV